MKAFRFRLQTKLDISVRQEQLARDELQIRIYERDRIIERLEEAGSRLNALEQAIRDFNWHEHGFQELLIKKEYIPVIKNQINNIEQLLYNAEMILEKARKVLMARIKEADTMKKLKEKDWQEYLHQLALEEQKIVDEIAINNHYRKHIS
ncbi:MAG: flagellar FliJ family protein, partial [Syntrophomonadaceae bacterium]|nr:flagellar FliJ family protein [Syntrophomonadaceae bacterium]